MVAEHTQRVTLVTGGGRGIGRAIARAFAAGGTCVAVVSRTSSALAVAKEIRSEGGCALGFEADVTDPLAVREVIQRVSEGLGYVEVLINAAAILGPTGPLLSNDLSYWSRTIEVNLLGTVNMIQSTLPHMVDVGWGRIVNFAGGGAAYGYPNFTAYGASKAAVVRLTESLAMEYGGKGVRVNVIAPGAVETDMLHEVRAAGGEVRTTVDVALPVRLALFLASEMGGKLNGCFIHSKDKYESWSEETLADDFYKLRRIDPWLLESLGSD